MSSRRHDRTGGCFPAEHTRTPRPGRRSARSGFFSRPTGPVLFSRNFHGPRPKPRHADQTRHRGSDVYVHSALLRAGVAATFPWARRATSGSLPAAGLGRRLTVPWSRSPSPPSKAAQDRPKRPRSESPNRMPKNPATTSVWRSFLRRIAVLLGEVGKHTKRHGRSRSTNSQRAAIRSIASSRAARIAGGDEARKRRPCPGSTHWNR